MAENVKFISPQEPDVRQTPTIKHKVLRTFREFVMEDEPLEFIVEGLLPDSGWTLLVGLPGIGKSTFAIQLAAALQAGSPFLGMQTKQRKVLYIQCDTPTPIWREQIRKIAPHSDALTMIHVPDHVLDSSQYVSVVRSVIEAVKPGFLVFDALNSLTARDINTKMSLSAIFEMSALATVGGVKLPWLLLHHPTKNSQNRGVNAASGFGGISASCATHLTLSSRGIRIEKGKLSAKRTIELLKDPQGLWYVDSNPDVDPELQGMLLEN